MRGGFKSELKNIFKNKKRWMLALIILIAGLLTYIIYFFYYIPVGCSDIACYKNSLLNCKRSWLINEDEKFVWRYEILGKENNNCKVEVRLLKINQGELEIEYLQDNSMICIVPKIFDEPPDKDLLRCSGILKEEFQEIIINKMHNYLLENLGQINEELQGI